MINTPHAIICGLGSDIGAALARRFNSLGWEISGTYRSSIPEDLNSLLDLRNVWHGDISNHECSSYLKWSSYVKPWDLFISAIGTQDPIGSFEEIPPAKWVKGVSDNSIHQIAAFMHLLPKRSKESETTAVFFAGGGTNSATPNYSAQTLGKIALIKFCELINEELEDLKPIIIGPGWVNTKIHTATLNNPINAKANYEKTINMISGGYCNPIEKVVEDITELIKMPKYLVGGRNFSSVHDNLSIDTLSSLHTVDKDFYRLRRHMNDFNLSKE